MTTKIPGLPPVPRDASPDVKLYLKALGEALEVRLGRRGDPRDRAVTLRELIDSGIATQLGHVPFNPDLLGTQTDFESSIAPDLSQPPAPTSLTASAAFQTVLLEWSNGNLQFRNFSFTEVYRNSSADVIGDAVLVAVVRGNRYADQVDSGSTNYYWVRHVSTSDIRGPFNATSGVAATTASIDTADLTDDLITAAKLADDAVTSAAIAADAVTNAKLAVDSIQGDVIAAGAIDGDKIASDAVTAVKIATDAITTTKIEDDAISTDKIAANAVTAAEIAANTITAAEIAANTITAGQIAANTVTAAEIAANAVTASEIAANAVTASEIAANTITAGEIAAGTVTAAEMAAGTITATSGIIADAAIVTAKIADAAVDNAKIANLDAAKITTGSLSANRINVDGATIVANSSGELEVDEISANKVTTGVLNASDVSIVNLNASEIVAGSIVSDRIDVTDLLLPTGGGEITGSTLGGFPTNTDTRRLFGAIGVGKGFYQGFIRIVGDTNHVKSMKFFFAENGTSIPGSTSTSKLGGTTQLNPIIYESPLTSALDGHVDRFFTNTDSANMPIMFTNSSHTGPVYLWVKASGDSGTDTLSTVEARFFRLSTEGSTYNYGAFSSYTYDSSNYWSTGTSNVVRFGGANKTIIANGGSVADDQRVFADDGFQYEKGSYRATVSGSNQYEIRRRSYSVV